MKIVMICEFFDENLEYQENHLAAFYVRSGHDVTVIASTFDTVANYYAGRHDAKLPRQDYVHSGVKIIKLPYRYNILNRHRAYVSIEEILEAESPDMIYIHSILPEIPQIIAHKRLNCHCRLILDYHGDYSNSGAGWISVNVLHRLVRGRYIRAARPHLDMIFPITPGSRDFLAEVYSVPLEEMEILPLGVDLAFGAKTRAQSEGRALRAELGIAPNDFVVFTGGKLDRLKKTDQLILALRDLALPDVHLLIVGEATEDHQAYKALLLELAGGRPNIHFRGWQDKAGVYRHMDAADIAVFPASQSVLWQQSLGMGLPLVVSERSELTSNVLQDVGYLNLYDNIITLDHEQPLPPQIAESITRLRDDPAARQRMASGARRVADELLDWNRLIERTLTAKSPAAVARG